MAPWRLELSVPVPFFSIPSFFWLLHNPTMLQHLPPNNQDVNPHISTTTMTGNSSSESKTPKNANPNNRATIKSKPLTPSSELFNLDNTDNDNINSSKSNNNSNQTIATNINFTDDDTINSSDADDPNTLSSTPNSNLTNSSRKFSFNKRPVSKGSKAQRKSSQISFIHNYPPQRCDSVDKDVDHYKFYLKYKGIMKDKDELPENVINDLSFEYNYDEKIRAPRMSVVSLYSRDSNHNNNNNNNNTGNATNPTLARQHSAPVIFKVNSNSSSNHTLDSLPEETNNGSNYSYKPATYDLSQKLRKFSISNDENNAVNNTDNVDNVGIALPHDEAEKTYNFQPSNVYPTKDGHPKNYNDFKPLKQIDEPTKLFGNYVPPVLRPIEPSTFDFQKKLENDFCDFNNKQNNHKTVYTKNSLTGTSGAVNSSTNKVNQSKQSLVSNESSNQKSPKLSKVHRQLLVQLKNRSTTESQQPNILETLNSPTSPTSNTDTSSNSNYNSSPARSTTPKPNKDFEPLQTHWKPNSATNTCESCRVTFNLFRRKHHCRRCGGIFCSKCLLNYSNLNILGHFEKPEYIKNTNHITSLLPIQSNETTETTVTLNSNRTNSTYTQNSNYISSENDSKDYSAFCKVCPSCYSQWLKFLESDEEYERRNQNLNYQELEDDNLNNSNTRKDSISAIPTNWMWSSF